MALNVWRRILKLIHSFYQEPLKLPQNRGDVVSGGGFRLFELQNSELVKVYEGICEWDQTEHFNVLTRYTSCLLNDLEELK